MGTQFSDGHPPPPPRFKPGPGQIGVHAATEGKSGGGKSAPTPARPHAQPGGGGAAIGRPTPEQPQQKSNAAEIMRWMHWKNASALGRDQPYAVWALRNGHGPGGYDFFQDFTP